MKFLVISDLHGKIENLNKLDEQFKSADGVIFAGDFAECFKEETGLPALEALCKKHDTIFSVIGNCDNPSFIAETESRDISVEKQLVYHEGLCFAGSGGGSKFTGETPNERTDDELISDLKIVTEQGEREWENLIVISHNPPKDSPCDMINGGIHVGSENLKKFIDDFKPLAVISGHIHESAGLGKIGGTLVLNPGALAEGKFAVMEVKKIDGKWNAAAELKEA